MLEEDADLVMAEVGDLEVASVEGGVGLRLQHHFHHDFFFLVLLY